MEDLFKSSLLLAGGGVTTRWISPSATEMALLMSPFVARPSNVGLFNKLPECLKLDSTQTTEVAVDQNC